MTEAEKTTLLVMWKCNWFDRSSSIIDTPCHPASMGNRVKFTKVNVKAVTTVSACFNCKLKERSLKSENASSFIHSVVHSLFLGC